MDVTPQVINGWSFVYEKAIRDDGSLFFPGRLSREFLDNAKRTMGSYLFANQYQNEIIPTDEQRFKKEWIKYHSAIPETVHYFAFIDPAMGLEEHNDYTGCTVVAVDSAQHWYVVSSNRYRYNPTQIVDLCFRLNEQFKPKAIGIESVAYQKALLYMLAEEMRRRGKMIPATEVKQGVDKTKETRILGLVPRFEWNRITLARGLSDLEEELATFPRSKHDDLLDSLAGIEQIVFYPTIKERSPYNEQNLPPPNHPDYERLYRKRLFARSSGRYQGDGSDVPG